MCRLPWTDAFPGARRLCLSADPEFLFRDTRNLHGSFEALKDPNEFWSPDCAEFPELASISIKVLETLPDLGGIFGTDERATSPPALPTAASTKACAL